MTALLSATGISKTFPIKGGVLGRTRHHVHAVSGVDLEISRGTTVGLVGESGSGKSTLGRVMARMLEPTAGTVRYGNRDITKLRGGELRRLRREIQVVFQDPLSSLDPLATVTSSLDEPLRHHTDLGRDARLDRMAELLGLVGLGPQLLERFPSELSGGQLQRISIARALAVDPKVLILDEPVSALDVSTQAEVVNLLGDLQHQLGLAMLFIAHDLCVVKHISDRIAVMYLGRIIEEGPADDVYDDPRHPYTQALLSAVPVPDPPAHRSRTRLILEGEIPSPASPPSGCRFHTRCPHVMDRCRVDAPRATELAARVVHCHLHDPEDGQTAETPAVVNTG